MSQARHYETKDSGVEWIGEIPREWSVKRGKNILHLLSRPILPGDDIVTCFRDGEVTLRKNRREEGFTNALVEAGYQGVEPGDLVVHGMDGFAGAIGVSDSRGKSSPVLNVLDSSENKRFLMYYLRATALREVFLALSTGIRVRSCDLRWNKLAVLPYILPPLPEQTAIVAYLDEKCATIDALVAEAKATIEEYKAWRASVIFEAVTKGLDPNAEMKDSGVEWIGEMPKDWNIVRFKRMHRGSNVGLSLDKDYWSTNEDDTVFYTAGLKSIHTSYKDIEPDMLTKENDLLLARNGTPYVYFPSIGAIYTDHIIRVGIENGYNKAFVRYCLQQSIANEVVDTVSIATWSVPIWNRQCLPHPSLAEQTAISDYLDSKCAAIDAIIAEKESLIGELEAYKKSLIFETVTGKRRVC